MFIAIVGTPSSGKRTILEYLVSRFGFEEIGLDQPRDIMEGAKIHSTELHGLVSQLTVSSETTPALTPSTPSPLPTPPITSPRSFSSASTMLDHVTRNWLKHNVTTDLRTFEDIQPFIKRPFFMLLFIDGPILTRFERQRRRLSFDSTTSVSITIDDFLSQHDLLMYGPTLDPKTPTEQLAKHPVNDFRRVRANATMEICNDFPGVEGLYAYLDGLDLMDEERLRPGWDTYFMTLASLASHRSNCMKRRVGALLVRSKRILSTGYNGTAKGVRNCNQGGCARCNGSARGGEALNECLCLHAEENALMEAGRERIGEDSVIYCNTCPCLRCSVKIVQCGVREVVYNQSYSMDEASARVLKEAGVTLRQLHMPE